MFFNPHSAMNFGRSFIILELVKKISSDSHLPNDSSVMEEIIPFPLQILFQ
jgi:hypothetical protein